MSVTVNATGTSATGSLGSEAVFFGVGANLSSSQTAEIQYMIAPGYSVSTIGYGWGAGGWGGGTTAGWGQGSTTPIILQQRDWWFDNFDNDLVMNSRNGPIYYWAYDDTFNTSAVLLSSLPGATDVPDQAMQILVSQNDKHLIAFGATPFGGGDFDRLLIRWANQDDPLNWTPSPLNTAGFIRVSRGSKIVRALPTRQETLVWTDSHLYALQFTGTTDVFALQEYADNISIVGPRACASANDVTYWMGKDKFYAYTGRLENLPCTVRDHVFSDLNFFQADQVIAGTNEKFQEIWWFYPGGGSQVNNKYVIFNYAENIWYVGTLNRTAWLDSPTRQFPQAASYIPFERERPITTSSLPEGDGIDAPSEGQGVLYNHEDGIDDDGSAMNAYIQSNDFDLGEGDKFILTKRIIPDVEFTNSTNVAPEVIISIRPRNFPGSGYFTFDDDSDRVVSNVFERYTNQIFLRARARQMAFKIASEQQGVQWSLGSPRLDAREDGKR